jgi:CBS domain containing-hemolysin-like protein
LSQLTGVDVALEGIDSLGGLVYHDLGRIAVVGDSVEIKGLQVTVVSTIGRRLKRLQVRLLESPSL